MKTKSLSLFLALVMILSAFAGTFTITGAAEVATDPNGAWKVNDKTYATLKDAVDARGDATTIYLIKDYAQSGGQVSLTFDGELTIEGVGDPQPVYSVAEEGGSGRLITVNSGYLTVKNIKVTNAVTTKGVIQINRGGLTLDGVTVENTDYEAGAIILTDGGIACAIKNSTLTALTGASTMTSGAGFIYLRGYTDLYVVDSTIDASAYSPAICSTVATTNIVLEDSTFKGVTGAAYAVQTSGAPYYNIGTVSFADSASTANTDATTTLTAINETAPTHDTAAEADAAAAAAGYIVRNNPDALAAMADINGDGLYWDGYAKGYLTGSVAYVNYMIKNISTTSRADIGAMTLDGQGSYTLTVTGAAFCRAQGGMTLRNMTFTATNTAAIQVEASKTLTFDNVNLTITGATMGVIIQNGGT